MMYACTYVGI